MISIFRSHFLKHRSFYSALAVSALTLTIAISATSAAIPSKKFSSPTETFITKHMRNKNGTFSTYLKSAASTDANLAAGREALSESLGLWMQYAVVKKNQLDFNQGYDLLTKYFMTSQSYIAWKLQPEGSTSVQTNALGDDLRIVDHLLKGYDKWPQERYLSTAQAITGTLQATARQNGYFVDFHDFQNNQSSSTLSLVYVDISALQAMRDHQLIDSVTYEQHVNVLLNMPKGEVFFPKTFDVNNKNYSYEDQVSLIDQLIVGIHLAELGEEPKELISFLKKELKVQKKLAGRYDRVTGKASVSYESPSVYGLATLLALECGDQEWAQQLNKKMLAFRGKDTAYPGGYVFDKNTHIFDNLFPLVAEVSLYSYEK